MIVSGINIKNAILAELKLKIANLYPKPRLGIIYVGDNPVIDRFVSLKEKSALEIGVEILLKKFDASVSRDELKKEIIDILEHVDGLIIQLPLPAHIPRQEILDLIPPGKDVDMLSSESRRLFFEHKLPIVPPVVGAILEVFERYAVILPGKKIAVVGSGHLVGEPFISWLTQHGIEPSILNSKTPDFEDQIREADIIVSGAGQPGLIQPYMLKPRAVVIDAGTSESGGTLQGDANPECGTRAGLFTPVPGGIGPITVATLFKNLILLKEMKL